MAEGRPDRFTRNRHSPRSNQFLDAERLEQEALQRARTEDMSEKDLAREIKRLEKLMLEHARNLEFEQAARVRDQLVRLKDRAFGAHGSDNAPLAG